MTESLSTDLMTGAEEIAEFLYGDRAKRRKVYYLAERRLIPTFRLGDIICARRSTLLDFIRKQEFSAIAADSSKGEAA